MYFTQYGRIGILGCLDLKKEARKEEEEEENPVWDVLVIETMEMTQVKIKNYTFWHCIVGPQLDFSGQNMLEKQYGISWPLRLWIWLKPRQGTRQDTFLIVGQLETFLKKYEGGIRNNSLMWKICLEDYILCLYRLMFPLQMDKDTYKAQKKAFVT